MPRNKRIWLTYFEFESFEKQLKKLFDVFIDSFEMERIPKCVE